MNYFDLAISQTLHAVKQTKYTNKLFALDMPVSLSYGFAAQDETGVYKNLLQETAHRAGLNLPAYSTIRSGPGHVPSFSCTVELAGKSFTGQPARTKKQAQKNAAMAAWSALRKSKRFFSCTLFSPFVSFLPFCLSILAFGVEVGI